MAKKSKKSGGKKKFVYPAPKDFKPFFAHILMRTGKDGLIQEVDCIRFKGRPDNPKAKQSLLSQHDPKTLAAIAARLGGATFVTNVAKRLPPKFTFRILARVGNNEEKGLRFGVKEIIGRSPDGTKKTLKKKHPWYRRIRRCARTMPAAFMGIGEFPKQSKKDKKDKDEDE
jgi:hypothetical protein